MIKTLMEKLDYGFFAESALLMFVLIFIGVAIRTFLIRSDDSHRQSMVVLNDGVEEDQ